MKFKFKNYCLILLDVKEILINDILKISENTPNIMRYNSQDIIVTTFSSNFNVNEISTYVKTFNVNFFIFEIGKKSDYHVVDSKTSKTLFGFINKIKDNPKKDFKIKFKLPDINENIINDNQCFKYNYKGDDSNSINIDFINQLDEDEIETEVNRILDKGYENMSKTDKIFIQNLIKK
jgi:hypothetical protein